MSGRRRQVAAALLVVTLVGGCGATATPTTPATGSGGPAPSVAVPSVGDIPVRTGALDPSIVAALFATEPTDPTQLAPQAADLGTAVRARVNAAAEYGSVAADLQSLMDQAEATAIQKLEDKIKAAGQASPGLASAGGGDGSTGSAGLALAAYRPSAAPPTHVGNMALLTVAMLLVVIAGQSGIGEFNPKVGDVAPHSITQELSQTSGTRTVDVNVTFTVSVSAGVVTVAVVLSGQGSGADAAGKAVTLSGDANIVFTINPCPDPGGKVSGTVAIADDETFATAGGPTTGYKINGNTDYVTQVNDNAEIDSTDMKANVDMAVTTVPAPTGDGTGHASTVDIGATASDSFGAGGAAGSGGSFSVDSISGPAQESDVRTLAGAVGTFFYGIPIMIGDFARTAWQSGRCMEIRPTPNGGTVSPGGVTPVTVKVWHWVDKAEVHVPVKATLNGAKAIDPSGQAQDSPGSFKYTAGPVNSTATVSWKVTSNRGTAMLDSMFKVVGGLRIDITGTYKESGFVWSYNLKVSAAGLLLTVHDDGSIDVTGNASVKGKATALNGLCTATINEKIPVMGMVTVAGTEDAPVYHTLIGPASTKQLGENVRCPNISVPSNNGDFFGQWSTTIGPVDLPAAGGTVSKSGTTASPVRQASGTFTATPN